MHGAFEDGFVTKLDPAGTAFSYSTFLGSDNIDYLKAIEVDPVGSAYVTGYAGDDYPTTPGSFAPSTIGGDAVLTKLNPSGTGLVYSTFLGSSGGGAGTDPRDIAVDTDGSAYLTGTTGRTIPTTPGAIDSTLGGQDAFAMELSSAGSTLRFGTYLGGSESDFAGGVALDSELSMIVVGTTLSTDYPTTPGAFQAALAGVEDAFVTRIVPFDGHVRPQAGTNLRVPLALAYQPCQASNRSHSGGLAAGSCNPALQSSSHLTVGTGDANGFAAQGGAFAKLAVCPSGTTGTGACSTPSGMSTPDLRMEAGASDIRCRAGVSTCEAATLSDYLGELQVSLTVRITDRHNSAGAPGSGNSATVENLRFPFSVSCSPNASGRSPATIGASCGVLTRANAVIPGSVPAGTRANWELGDVEVYDGGPDGVASTADNTLFLRQGVFVP
jgi:hypothetical protein